MSYACGCSNDLVIHNSTGWLFKSNDPENLLKLLHLSDLQSVDDRQSMVALAKERVSAFDVDNFALALQNSCDYALSVGKSSIRSRVIAWALSGF